MIDTSLDSFNFYFILAVIQGLILAALIIFNRPFRKPNLFLGLLVLLFSLSLLHLVLEESIHAFNSEFPVPMDFGMAFGPLIYLHIVFVKSPNRLFKKIDLLHFIPTLLFDVVFFSCFFLYIRFNIDWAYDNLHFIQQLGLSIAFIGILQLISYLVLSYREAKSAQYYLSDFQSIHQWLKYILVALGIFILFILTAVPISLLFIEQLDDNSYLVYKPLGIILGLCIYGLGYLYLLHYLKAVGRYMDRVKDFKYTLAELDDKKNQLINLFENDQAHHDSSLTIGKLATIIGWPVNELSLIINEVFDVNYNDLINRYRVKDFIFLAKQPESKKYSLIGLSQEVGFQSKASFYRAFKKEMGVTPTEYLG